MIASFGSQSGKSPLLAVELKKHRSAVTMWTTWSFRAGPPHAPVPAGTIKRDRRS